MIIRIVKIITINHQSWMINHQASSSSSSSSSAAAAASSSSSSSSAAASSSSSSSSEIYIVYTHQTLQNTKTIFTAWLIRFIPLGLRPRQAFQLKMVLDSSAGFLANGCRSIYVEWSPDLDVYVIYMSVWSSAIMNMYLSIYIYIYICTYYEYCMLIGYKLHLWLACWFI